MRPTGSTASSDRDARCVWKEDDDGVWHTACGDEWVFTEGYPWDNKARFCFVCGRVIEAEVWREEPETDDAVDPALASSVDPSTREKV